MRQSEFEHTLLQARPYMMATAMRFFQNKEDAEDVVQEVCARMLERGWHEGDNTEALLIKATKNLCVSVWRRQRLSESEPFPPPLEGTGEASDAPLLRREQQEKLDKAIGKLPASEQRLICMKGEDLSLEEMQARTGIARRTLSTMLWQAKKRLQTILKQNNDEE